MSADLSPFELHALEALRGTTPYGDGTYPSAVGHAMWEKSDPETRKRNPSPQGLALFAGKFLRGLAKRGYAGQYKGWYITKAGQAALEKTK